MEIISTSQIKENRGNGWPNTQDPTFCYPKETSHRQRDPETESQRLEVNWSKPQTSWCAILISDKVDCRQNVEDENYYIMGIIHQEAITIINRYVLNVEACSFIKSIVKT